MNVPRVSIVTPSFNQAQFIEKTILSVINQDYPDIEYIIIDGGSTDGSQEIIKKYEDKIAYWVSEKDNGQSDAINKGFRRCTGEYVAWINSDDLYVEGAVSRIVKFFTGHLDADMVHGNIDFIDVHGKLMENVPTGDFTLPELLLTNRISQPSVFFKRKIFDDIGYLDEAFHYVMDYDFWIRVAVKHNVRHVGSTIAQFRLHGESKTISSNDLFLIEILIILDRLLKDGGLPAGAEKAIFLNMQSILPGFQFNRMDKLQKYLEPDDHVKMRKLLELADYQSGLVNKDIRYADIKSIRQYLHNFFTCYVSQYDGFRQYVTDRSIDAVVEDEMYNIAYNISDKGHRRRSIILFVMLMCMNPSGLKYHNVKRLMKKYLQG